MCVCVQGKETTEEEDEVAVGMEKGFMDEFFEQVCFSLCHPHSHLEQTDGRLITHRVIYYSPGHSCRCNLSGQPELNGAVLVFQ